MRRLIILQINAVVLAVVLLPTVAPAEAAPPDYGLDWAVIGDPGNRDTNEVEAPGFDPGRGGVDYTYRMTRTELTVWQWYEFVQAYLPYYEWNGFYDPAFGGSQILFSKSDGVISAGIISDFWVDTPANMSWEYAARYCNWLHNGKVNEEWAFESGAYDTSTFTQNPDGSWNHQLTRSPGAKFWIPSLDEWIKAAYWDPEKDGGKGGYWQYPDGSNEPLIADQPEDGGETNAGDESKLGPLPWDAGSYPDTMSPWGLLDLSGGMQEWTESGAGDSDRIIKWSHHGSSGLITNPDFIDSVFSGTITGGAAGLRVTGIIPVPATGAPLVGYVIFVLYRRR